MAQQQQQGAQRDMNRDTEMSKDSGAMAGQNQGAEGNSGTFKNDPGQKSTDNQRNRQA